MQATYQPTIDRIIAKYEGGYGWNKHDRGGPTKYGITCFDLAQHRNQPMQSMSAWAPEVQRMPLNEAEYIYSQKYAIGLSYDRLRAGIDACMLDYAINSGVARPIRVACKLLAIAARSTMNSELLAAINKADALWFINAMCQERLAFMHGIRGGSDWSEFGHGWQARVDDVERYSRSLVTGVAPVVPAPDLSKTPTPKATHTDPHLGKKTIATAGTTAPAASATAHAAGASPIVALLILAAVVATTVAGYFYLRRRNAQANATVILPLTIPPQPVMHVQV